MIRLREADGSRHGLSPLLSAIRIRYLAHKANTLPLFRQSRDTMVLVASPVLSLSVSDGLGQTSCRHDLFLECR